MDPKHTLSTKLTGHERKRHDAVIRKENLGGTVVFNRSVPGWGGADLGPWINQAERYFGLISGNRIRRGVFNSMAKLAAPSSGQHRLPPASKNGRWRQR